MTSGIASLNPGANVWCSPSGLLVCTLGGVKDDYAPGERSVAAATGGWRILRETHAGGVRGEFRAATAPIRCRNASTIAERPSTVLSSRHDRLRNHEGTHRRFVACS